MKVKYIGDYYKVAFERDKEYDVIGEESGCYRIVSEFDDDGLFPKEDFEITDKDDA